MMANDPLLRSCAGVLVGYVVLMALSVLGAAGVRGAIGLDPLYEPGRFAPTPLGIALQLAVALLAAFIAGLLCRRVAGGRRPVGIFAALIFVLSWYQSLFAVTVPNAAPNPRTGSESAEVFQAETLAQQPKWLTLAQPPWLVTVILLGSRRRRNKVKS